MDESIKCECGSYLFWYFGKFSRCTKCYNEYKVVDGENWMRRFNKEENAYSQNWEHYV